MLSKEENEILTRVGPGTMMGDLMREYWLPFLYSWEVAPDGPPLRVRLLGEDLIVFRDSEGKLGLLGAHCPHRGAALFFGRNEECGLRCVYHGWKFDADGRCVDMPSEPAESTFQERVRQRAYPCEELGGVIWAYLGPPAHRPPLPTLEWMRAPAGASHVSKTYEECNYLQGIEGGIDTSHSSYLHYDPTAGHVTQGYRRRSRAPRLDVQETDYGFAYTSSRALAEEGQTYIRVYHFVMPFYQLRAYEGYDGRPLVQGHMWVPMDDEHTWVYNWLYARDGSTLGEALILEVETRSGRGPAEMLPGYRLKRNKANDYLIDRALQRSGHGTGIRGVNTQDWAIQESMGPIVDRTREHLGTSDLAIIAMRRLMLQATRDVADGRDPLGLHGSAHAVRPAEMVLPADAPWSEAMRETLVARW
jgi:phthalate 4,5-dioxygenase oxygenase subunit